MIDNFDSVLIKSNMKRTSFRKSQSKKHQQNTFVNLRADRLTGHKIEFYSREKNNDDNTNTTKDAIDCQIQVMKKIGEGGSAYIYLAKPLVKGKSDLSASSSSGRSKSPPPNTSPCHVSPDEPKYISDYKANIQSDVRLPKKIVLKASILTDEHKLYQINNEVKMLKSLRGHPFIVQIYNSQIISYKQDTFSSRIEEMSLACILLEYMKCGTLMDLIFRHSRMQEQIDLHRVQQNNLHQAYVNQTSTSQAFESQINDMTQLIQKKHKKTTSTSASIFSASSSLKCGRGRFKFNWNDGVPPKVQDIVAGGFIQTRDLLSIFIQITLAVQFLHSRDITHRDLKPENVLLMENPNLSRDSGLNASGSPNRKLDKTVFSKSPRRGSNYNNMNASSFSSDITITTTSTSDFSDSNQNNDIISKVLSESRYIIKLCDFGSAVQPSKIPLETSQDRQSQYEIIQKTTTQIYRAPEMIDLFSVTQLNEKTDIWALGCIFFTSTLLKNCFREGENLQILRGSAASVDSGSTNSIIPPQTIRSYSHEPILSLITDKMLIQDANERSNATHVLKCLLMIQQHGSHCILPPHLPKSSENITRTNVEKAPSEKKPDNTDQARNHYHQGNKHKSIQRKKKIKTWSNKKIEAKKLNPSSVAARRKEQYSMKIKLHSTSSENKLLQNSDKEENQLNLVPIQEETFSNTSWTDVTSDCNVENPFFSFNECMKEIKVDDNSSPKRSNPSSPWRNLFSFSTQSITASPKIDESNNKVPSPHSPPRQLHRSGKLETISPDFPPFLIEENEESSHNLQRTRSFPPNEPKKNKQVKKKAKIKKTSNEEIDLGNESVEVELHTDSDLLISSRKSNNYVKIGNEKSDPFCAFQDNTMKILNTPLISSVKLSTPPRLVSPIGGQTNKSQNSNQGNNLNDSTDRDSGVEGDDDSDIIRSDEQDDLETELIQPSNRIKKKMIRIMKSPSKVFSSPQNIMTSKTTKEYEQTSPDKKLHVYSPFVPPSPDSNESSEKSLSPQTNIISDDSTKKLTTKSILSQRLASSYSSLH